jgi:colicin import membrane protein
MNRLQKKCMIVSAGIHLLLAAMLILGSAFLTSRSHDNDIPLLKFVPVATVDALVSGGGDNTVKAPPALATSPEPPAAAPEPEVVQPVQVPQPPVVEQPTPQKIEKPAPVVKETPKVEIAVKPSPSPAKSAPRRHEITPNLTLKTTSASDAKAKREAQAKAAAAAAAAEQRRIAAAFGKATAGIRGGVSGSTEIKLIGPGGGGVPYANFLSAVQTVYYNAWRQPDSAPELVAKVSVSIARDGTVISARLLNPSGNSSVDKSVQETIERVKYAAPLPASATEESRTVIVNFKTQPPEAG